MFTKLSKGPDTDIAQRVIEPSRKGKCPFFSFGKKSDLVQSRSYLIKWFLMEVDDESMMSLYQE